MTEHAKRLREFPTRQRVRRITLVKYCNRRLERRVAQIGIEVRQLTAGKQPLVHERPARQRANVERREAKGFSAMLHLATCEIQLALPRIVVSGTFRSAHQDLSNARHRVARRLAQHFRAHGYISPPKQWQAVGSEHFIDDARRQRQRLGLGRQEKHSHRKRRVGREVQSLTRRGEDEQATWDLRQHAGAVGRKIGGRCAAVRQSRCRFECERYDFVCPLAALSSNEAYAARIARREG